MKFVKMRKNYLKKKKRLAEEQFEPNAGIDE